ncbi:glycosyltransferase family 1 protein [Patescibacteria group bacterium]|nr:MAG: glycosyltransferase family 1 protein [Patescibacteria group bacterium]
MTIAIDARDICALDGSRGAGIGHYTWSIVRALCALTSHPLVVAVPAAFSRREEEELKAVRPQADKATGLRVVRMGRRRLPFVGRHLVTPIRLMMERPDLLFCPSGEAPLGWRGPSVVTVHDLSVYDHPDWFPEGDRDNWSRRLIFPRSVRRAAAVIAVSRATRASLAARFPESSGKTVVIHEGVSLPDAFARASQPDDLVLSIGTVEPRKNYATAIRAFDAYLRRCPDRAAGSRYVIAGAIGWKAEDTLAAADAVNEAWRAHAPDGLVRVLGAVTEQEKWSLLARAGALLIPSWHEGFGLPALEAMAAGVPVIASTGGALPEVVGDAGILVAPDDAEAMSLALAQCLLLPDGTKELVEEGKRRAAAFTWERAARETLKVLEEVVRV